MAVLGKVAGTMLKDNLLRNGVDLQIDSNLMYYDVSNRRIGINTISPGNALTVNGSVTASNVYVNNTSVTALNGNLILNSLTGNINANTLRIFNLGDPINNQDAVTKNYFDNIISSVSSPNLYVSNANTGNTNILLNSETLYLIGNTNQINVEITSNTATFSLASNVIVGNLNSNNVNTTNLYATNASLTGNLNIAGNINNISGGIFGTSGIFYGDPTTGAGALYGGVPGYTFLPNVVLQVTGNINSYAQVNFQNKSTGTNASTDYILTADNGTDSSRYLDLGINGSGYNDLHFTIGGANDGYLYVAGSSSDGPSGLNQGNLILGSTNGVVRTFVGNTIIENNITTVTANGLTIQPATVSSSKTTGALTVIGGLGVAGNVYASAIQNTPIGNGTASTGQFTSVATVSGGQISGYLTGAIGANTPNTGVFTNVTTSGSSGNISGANYIFASLFSGNLTGAVGNINPNSGVFTSVNTVNGGQISGYLTGAIGANTANTGAFTTVTATTFTGTHNGPLNGPFNGTIGDSTPNSATFTSLSITGGLQNTPVGNGTPSTGNFTNITSTTSNIGNFYISNNTITVTNTDGNINLTPLGNGIVSINSTSAILMPSGNNTNRPASPTTGMTRYNSVLQGLEVWNGTEWTSAAGYAPSSVIVSDKFTGTGSQVDFILSQDSTSSGTMVSINGVLQVPDINYSISGNVLTLVEAPISTDIVEVRSLSTLSTITAMVVGNSSIRFGTPANSYPITVSVGDVAQAYFTTTNTYFYSNVVTSTGIYWPNGNAYASTMIPGGINSSLQFNNSQILDGSTYLTYNSSSGNLVSNSTTKSTSLTTGAVVIGNGLAVGGNVFANAIYSDNHFFANGITITTPPAGSNTMIQFANSSSFGGTTYLRYNYVSGNLISNSATTSTSTTTGAIVVSGGVAIGGNLNVGSSLNVTSNAQISSLGIGTAASGTVGEIRATNNVTAYYSDDRLKKRLGNIENALEKLVSLNGFNYQPNRLAQSLGYALKDEVGISAQEVQKVLPSAVVPAPIDDKYLTVHYDRLIPLLIEAIKELTAKVKHLEGK